MIDWKNAEWDTTVCHSMQLDKQTVVDAILNGATSMPSLERKMNAGAGCGTCRGALQELIKLYGAPAGSQAGCCGSGHCS